MEKDHTNTMLVGASLLDSGAKSKLPVVTAGRFNVSFFSIRAEHLLSDIGSGPKIHVVRMQRVKDLLSDDRRRQGVDFHGRFTDHRLEDGATFHLSPSNY